MKHVDTDSRRRPAFHAMALVVAMAIVGQTLPVPAVDTSGLTRICRDLYRDWNKKLPHRAFAASQIVNGLQACDISWGWETQEKAIAKAISLCKRDDRMRNLKLGDSCRVIKVH